MLFQGVRRDSRLSQLFPQPLVVDGMLSQSVKKDSYAKEDIVVVRATMCFVFFPAKEELVVLHLRA